MEEKAAVFLEVCAGDGLAAGTFGIECRRPENDVLAVESAVALTDRHCRLPRVVPNGGEAIALRIEAGDSRACALGSVRIGEREIGLQKLAVLDHVLLAYGFRHDRLPIGGEECLHDIPLADELCQQLLTGARSVRRLVLIMALLRDRHPHERTFGASGGPCDRRSRDEQNRYDASCHGTR